MSSSNKFQFSSFKSSFSTNVSALKRRFSSGDLENDQYEDTAKEVIGDNTTTAAAATVKSSAQNDVAGTAPPMATTAAAAPPAAPTRGTSAPTSPSRSTSSGSIFQRLQSVTGVAREVTRDLTSQVISTVQQGTTFGAATATTAKIPYKDPNTLILLVIDDSNTDWSKYFTGRKLLGTPSLTISTEQCEFSELCVLSYEGLTVASYIQSTSSGGRQLRQFVPDFVLIRQNLRDAGRDYKNALLAFMYGGISSVNSLAAIYNFQDKPWVFAHMLAIQRRVPGFPLIEQNFYPYYRDMKEFTPKIPAVLKIGHAHGGLGKIKVNSIADYQDASSVVAVTGTYCTSEPYVESRCDVHIQKIGSQYKAFMRKGIVGHWKSGSGSAMLEQVPMTDKYRSWVDGVATLFGGLDICALEVLVGKDGREWIIEVNDSALTLMGESQEEDRRHIGELVLSRMNVACKAPLGTQQQQQQLQQRYRRLSNSDNVDNAPTTEQTTSPRRDSQGSSSSGGVTNAASSSGAAPATSSAAQSLSNKLFSRQNSQQSVVGGDGGQQQPPPTGAPGTTDGEDTMKNLRKTFAGIFGDM